MDESSKKTDWSELEAALEDLLDMPVEERETYLDSSRFDDDQRRQLSDLLAAADAEPTLLQTSAGGFLGGDLDAMSDSTPGPAEAAEEMPESVGPYRLLELLGRGGMGAVYLARRTDGVHSAKVAVKLLQGQWLDPLTVRRFHDEREILASLHHPDIARMLDGGTTEDGRPYLVMEWVDGLPIDRWCAKHEVSLEDRLRLFARVCAAVHSAHQNLVVHRDLKPGNILVDREGNPKLLDFGIAKLLDDALDPLDPDAALSAPRTVTGMAPLTPVYASPEQIAGGVVTTAADVYALGVLLYQLLCGRRPHEPRDGQDYLDLLVAIREDEPTVPSVVVARRRPNDETLSLTFHRLDRRLRGDLDQISLQALAKDPGRRYPSAEQLAADVERHLAGLPVEASAAGFGYRLGKFIARHRAAVAASTLAVALLLGSLIALLVQRQATFEQRDRAELTTRFLVDQFHDTDPLAEAAPSTVRELLDRGAERLATMQAPDTVRADLQTAMGRAYLGVGELDRAHELLTQALATQEKLGESDALADTLLLLSEVDVDRGRPVEGLEWARRALHLASDESTMARAQLRIAYSERILGHFEVAEPLLRQVLSSINQPDTSSRAERAEVAWTLGMLLSEDGRYDEAQEQLGDALQQHQTVFGDEHPRTARVLTSLGVLASKRGQFDEGRRLLGNAQSLHDERLAPLHPDRLSLQVHRARLEQRAGKSDTAETMLVNAVSRFRGEASAPQLAEAIDELGALQQRRGEYDAAQKNLDEALAMRLELFGDTHPEVAESLEHLAFLHIRRGELEPAIDKLQRAFDIVGATLGEDHPRRGAYLRHIGNVLLRQDRHDEALAIFERARLILEPRLGDADAQVAGLYNSLGFVKHELGDLDAGRQDFERAITVMERAWGKDHARVGLYRNNLARLELDAGNLDAAWSEAEAARELLSSLRYGHSHRLRSDVLRSRCLIALQRPGEAETMLRQRLSHLDASARPRTSDLQLVLKILVEAIEAQGGKAVAERHRLAGLVEPGLVEPGLVEPGLAEPHRTASVSQRLGRLMRRD